ncbi:MAG: metal ABC transporter solute-binding protein, Zn/Mn family [Candidatus Dependentiae bacterium]
MKKLLTIFVILNILACVFFLTNKQHISHSSAKRIVCTTTILADTAKQIAGDEWHITSLMGPGVDPHTYHATEQDVHALASAHLILYHGLHLEGKMVHLLEHMNQYTKSVGVCDLLPQEQLISSEIEGIYDPHVWHDVALWKIVVQYIANVLVEIDPTKADHYQKRAQEYLAKLTQLEAYIQNQINLIPLEQRVLITAHDAFSYYGLRYGIRVMGLQGVSTDAEAGTRDIQELVQFIVANKIKAIFVESSISPRNIQAVQHGVQAQNWRVAIGPELYSDALGDIESDAKTYYDMVRFNTNVITSSLS